MKQNEIIEIDNQAVSNQDNIMLIEEYKNHLNIISDAKDVRKISNHIVHINRLLDAGVDPRTKNQEGLSIIKILIQKIKFGDINLNTYYIFDVASNIASKYKSSFIEFVTLLENDNVEDHADYIYAKRTKILRESLFKMKEPPEGIEMCAVQLNICGMGTVSLESKDDLDLLWKIKMKTNPDSILGNYNFINIMQESEEDIVITQGNNIIYNFLNFANCKAQQYKNADNIKLLPEKKNIIILRGHGDENPIKYTVGDLVFKDVFNKIVKEAKQVKNAEIELLVYACYSNYAINHFLLEPLKDSQIALKIYGLASTPVLMNLANRAIFQTFKQLLDTPKDTANIADIGDILLKNYRQAQKDKQDLVNSRNYPKSYPMKYDVQKWKMYELKENFEELTPIKQYKQCLRDIYNFPYEDQILYNLRYIDYLLNSKEEVDTKLTIKKHHIGASDLSRLDIMGVLIDALVSKNFTSVNFVSLKMMTSPKYIDSFKNLINTDIDHIPNRYYSAALDDELRDKHFQLVKKLFNSLSTSIDILPQLSKSEIMNLVKLLNGSKINNLNIDPKAYSVLQEYDFIDFNHIENEAMFGQKKFINNILELANTKVKSISDLDLLTENILSSNKKIMIIYRGQGNNKKSNYQIDNIQFTDILDKLSKIAKDKKEEVNLILQSDYSDYAMQVVLSKHLKGDQIALKIYAISSQRIPISIFNKIYFQTFSKFATASEYPGGIENLGDIIKKNYKKEIKLYKEIRKIPGIETEFIGVDSPRKFDAELYNKLDKDSLITLWSPPLKDIYYAKYINDIIYDIEYINLLSKKGVDISKLRYNKMDLLEVLRNPLVNGTMGSVENLIKLIPNIDNFVDLLNSDSVLYNRKSSSNSLSREDIEVVKLFFKHFLIDFNKLDIQLPQKALNNLEFILMRSKIDFSGSSSDLALLAKCGIKYQPNSSLSGYKIINLGTLLKFPIYDEMLNILKLSGNNFSLIEGKELKKDMTIPENISAEGKALVMFSKEKYELNSQNFQELLKPVLEFVRDQKVPGILILDQSYSNYKEIKQNLLSSYKDVNLKIYSAGTMYYSRFDDLANKAYIKTFKQLFNTPQEADSAKKFASIWLENYREAFLEDFNKENSESEKQDLESRYELRKIDFKEWKFYKSDNLHFKGWQEVFSLDEQNNLQQDDTHHAMGALHITGTDNME